MNPTDPETTSLPPFIQKILESKEVENQAGEPVPLHSNISDKEALEIYQLVLQEKPKLSAEVGFANGISCLSILFGIEANGQGHHHVMDPYQDQYGNCGLAMVEKSGLQSRMTFHRQFAEEVIPGLETLDMAFIDASHLFDLTLMEFVLVDKKLRPGGVVGFHDLWMPSLQQLMRFILSNRKYEVVPSPSHGRGAKPSVIKEGLRRILSCMPGHSKILARDFVRPWKHFQLANMVWLRKLENDQRDWRHFVRF